MFIQLLRNFRRNLSIKKYKGDKYECPFCGFKSSTHFEIGVDSPVLTENQVIGGGKRLGGCYKCNSVDRVRLVYLYLTREYDLFSKPRDLKILHFAPETHISDRIIKAGFTNYTCGDLFTEGYEYPDYVQNLNILDLSFPENSFDLIICNHVLEHIIPDDLAMKALYSVLKPNGTAILQVPISAINKETIEDPSVNTNEERLSKFGQYDHIRIYGQDYADRLKNAGFQVVKSDFNKNVLKYGVIENESIYIASK